MKNEMFKFNKKGSVSVYLVIMFSSIILMVFIFINQSVILAQKSYSDAVLRLAGRAILSEYDIELNERYGILAFKGDEKTLENKLYFYSKTSFSKDNGFEIFGKEESFDPLNLKINKITVDLKGYQITNIEIFKRQILDEMTYGAGKIVLDKMEEKNSNNKSNVNSNNQNNKENSNTDSIRTGILRNERIIVSLPSYGTSKSHMDFKELCKNGIISPKEIISKNKDIYLIDEYLLFYFNNRINTYQKSKTFFNNEIEYILNGDFDDEKNYKSVKNDMRLIRIGLNTAHIYGDAVKRKETLALATAMTPGPEALITQAVITLAWATAEAENDLRILEDGKAVALVKTKKNWALDLNFAYGKYGVEGYADSQKGNYIKPLKMEGLSYEDYLRIMLYFEKEDLKLLRSLDLIEINLKGSYSETFDLIDYYGGFEFEAFVNDEKYSYSQKF